MQVTLLGTGCPQVHTRRYGPASLVRAGDRRFLIDCGSGVTQRLVGAGTSGAALDALLLTHLHSDHLVDLYQLIVSSWHQGRDRPQRIFGPRRHQGLRRSDHGGLAKRARAPDPMGVPAVDRGARARDHRVRGGRAAGRRTASGSAPSRSTTARSSRPSASCSRAPRAGSRSRATRRSATVSSAPRGASICWCTNASSTRRCSPAAAGGGTRASRTSPPTTRSPPRSARSPAARGAGMLLLNHFVPVEFDRAALLAEVRADFAGPLDHRRGPAHGRRPQPGSELRGLTLGLGSG